MLGRLVCGLVLVMTAVPGPPGSLAALAVVVRHARAARRAPPAAADGGMVAGYGRHGHGRGKAVSLACVKSAAAPARRPTHHHKDPGPAIPSRQFAPFRDRERRRVPAIPDRIRSDSHWLADHNPVADNPTRIFPKFAALVLTIFQGPTRHTSRQYRWSFPVARRQGGPPCCWPAFGTTAKGASPPCWRSRSSR